MREPLEQVAVAMMRGATWRLAKSTNEERPTQ
jgi:hypothetical protein